MRRMRRAAAEKLAKGTSFDDLVKERELKETDVDLGSVSKTDVIDPAVAEAAFALKEGETSAPVTGRFGTVIVQVKDIQPGRQQAYEEVAGQIKNAIAANRARTEIAELRDKIEDERAGGATLAETAEKLKLASRTIESIDRSGRDAAGNPVANLPPSRELIPALFNSDVGVDSEPVQIQPGGFVWYEVVNITRSRERTLDEVKAQVETRWKNDQIATRLKAKADEMTGALKAGTAIEKVATDSGLKVEAVADLQRNNPKPPVSGAALEEIFRLAKGAAGTAEGDARSDAPGLRCNGNRGAETRCRHGAGGGSRCRPRAAPTPKTSWRNMSPSSKASSAFASTRPPCNKSSAAPRSSSCRSSRRSRPSPSDMRKAKRRSSGPVSSPISKPRSRLS